MPVIDGYVLIILRICVVIAYDSYICCLIQFLNEKKFEQAIPPVKVEDAKKITSEIATNALRRGVNFLSALQASDGHWPAENAGPLFFLPPLVCLYLL